MTISIVNGYVCEGACDVAKASRGEDPHPATTVFKPENGRAETSGVSSLDGPAVLFGGALAELFTASAVPAISGANAGAPSAAAPGNRLDVTV